VSHVAASVSCALAVLFQAAGRVAALSRDVLSVTTLLAFLLSRTIALPGSSNVGGIHHCKQLFA
jgi:hypothetical protein